MECHIVIHFILPQTSFWFKDQNTKAKTTNTDSNDKNNQRQQQQQQQQ